jgi:hypothetical protein
VIDWFSEKIIGAKFHCLDRRFNGADAGQHDGGGGYLGGLDKFYNAAAADIGQSHIKEGQVKLIGFQVFDGLCSGGCLGTVIIEMLQDAVQAVNKSWFIVNQKNI